MSKALLAHPIARFLAGLHSSDGSRLSAKSADWKGLLLIFLAVDAAIVLLAGIAIALIAMGVKK